MKNSIPSNHHNYMYYFDGRGILMDKEPKFDQVFDEDLKQSKNLNQSYSKSNYNINNNNNNAYQNSVNSNFYNSNNHNNDNFKNTNNSNYNNTNNNFNNTNNSNNNYNNQISAETVYDIIKDQFQKSKGYPEYRANLLYNFFLEYRTFDKRHLKIPMKIQPLMNIPNQDIKTMLEEIYRQFLIKQEQNKSKRDYYNRKLASQNKPKFTKDTLKRLYPKAKDNELENVRDYDKIEKLFERIVYHYYYKNNDFKNSNEDEVIISFWQNTPPEEKTLYNLNFDAGENALSANIQQYLSENEVMNRITSSYEKICGYKCLHPRPLHDYWQKQINDADKYLRGLNKFDADKLYQLLHDRYLNHKEEKVYEKDTKKQELEKKQQEEAIKYKREKDEYKKILEKFKKLAQAKDKWRTGKVMLRLRKKFNYDNIINKMIKQEFSTNRPFKLSDEYAIYDSDEERKTIFKSEVEKKLEKENENRILENIQKTKLADDEAIKREEKEIEKINNADKALEKYLRKEVLKYYRRLNIDKEQPSSHKKKKLMRQIYAFMKKNHFDACQRRFPKNLNYGSKSKTKNVPKELISYFNKVYNRLFIDGEGKVYFSKLDNMSFWAPCHSNKCKIHSNNCPLYCLNNTQNREIALQRKMNFKMVHDDEKKLLEDERLHLWKRKDIIEEKKKIFLCLNEAEHCTFEPNFNKKENELTGLDTEQIAKKRLSNKAWVEKMGTNLTASNCLIYKEGVAKKARIAYNSGKFTDCMGILKKAFDIDRLLAHFDPKFEKIYKERMEKEKTNEDKEFNYDLKHKKEVPEDRFGDPKNLVICEEVYYMLKDIYDYRDEKKKQAKKLQDELLLIRRAKADPSIRMKMNNKTLTKSTKEIVNKETSNIENKNKENNENSDNKDNKDNIDKDNNSITQSTQYKTKASTFNLTIHQAVYINERYFKYFKTMMCPLKSECPYDIRPRWPHSDLKANTPFGFGCQYAHHVSELKFEEEMNEKIRSKQNKLNMLKKIKDPIIENEWNPTGQLHSCNGCGKTYGLNKKGGVKICGFCRYTQHNDLVIGEEKKRADISNKKILKNINYVSTKPEDWDQSFEHKFGILKKASILFSFRRYVDSLNVISRAKELVDEENIKNTGKFKDLDIRWRAKLEISDKIIPKEILSYEITEETIKHFKIENIPLSTLLVYADKMRKGNDFSIFNRHTYLNNQIVIFYEMVTKKIKSYEVECKSINNQIKELNAWMTKKEKLRNENPKLFKKFSNKYKIQMCPNIKTLGKCKESYHDCKFAHHPNILNLTQPETQIKLLQNNLDFTKNKMVQSKTIIPFVPPKKNLYEQSKVYAIIIIKFLK